MDLASRRPLRNARKRGMGNVTRLANCDVGTVRWFSAPIRIKLI